MDTLFGKTQKLAEDLDEQMIQNDSLTKELQGVEGEVKLRDNQITGLQMKSLVFNGSSIEKRNRWKFFASALRMPN